ncbi:MAG: formyltransferase family protein, partial [Gammaproteobacteria bacterium]
MACGQVLIDSGYNVALVVTGNTKVCEWAKQKNICVIENLKILEASLADFEFDFLFSIVNYNILSDQLLKKARCLAINFHDAPLPRYAGVHATTWAILAGEKTHGITWHAMNVEVDAGEILEQVLFPIEDSETALSLNLKCYEAAIESLKSLATKLKSYKVVSAAQNRSLRVLFTWAHIFKNNGVLLWHESAEEIDRQIRALKFGNYPNGVASTKLFLENEFIIVDGELARGSLQQASQGTVVHISAQHLIVSAAGGNILLKKFTTLSGAKLDLVDIVRKHHLQVGNVIPSLSEAQREQLATLSQRCKKHERYWVTRFKSLVEIFPHAIFPKPQWVNSKSTSVSRCKIAQKNSGEIPKEQHVFASTLIYLSCLNNFKPFIVWISSDNLKQCNKVSMSLFADKIPILIEFRENWSFEKVVQEANDAVSSAFARETYELDITTRYLMESEKYRPDIIYDFSNFEDTNIDENSRIKFHVIEAPNGTELILTQAENASSVLLDINLIAEIHSKILQNKEGLLNSVALISSNEYHKQIETWNQTQAAYPSDRTVVELFEAQVSLSPEAIAVEGEGVSLSYQA